MGAPIPCGSISEFRRIGQIKAKVSDEQLMHLALRELPAAIFAETTDFNYGFHNQTGMEFTVEEMKVLGYGHKFVMAGYGPSKRQLQQALHGLNRRVLLRDYFAQKEAIEGKSTVTQAPDRRLSVKNPHFNPLTHGFIQHPGEAFKRPFEPNAAVIMFLDILADNIHRNLRIVRKEPINDNMSLEQREAVTAILENLDIVLAEADKNKGWVAMLSKNYEAMGLRMLRLSHIECDESEQIILNAIQQKFADVLEKHSELLERWKSNDCEKWREKYFTMSVSQNPQTRKPYRISNYRELKKLNKPDSRGITGAHVSPTQPFALYYDIMLTPAVRQLPHFLKDCDELSRQMSTLVVKPTDVFVTADVVRLYPNINIAKCIVLLCQFVQERITAADPTIDMDSASLALFHDIMEIVLQENYCHFADRVFKAVKGFPTGIACGRSCAEIYLHMLERHLWTLFRPHMTFFRRYIDDFQGVFTSEGPARAFISAYGNLDDSVQITADVSETSFVMLDTRALKGEHWKETGLLDLQLYQKPDSAF